jgi:hypothetical protein
MPLAINKEWNLESFIDSLVMELDKARELLAVKAINRPLTYTVKDVGLDLNLFPTYDGDEVRFVTAQPGQTGASKLSIQLGSITDQQIRLTSKEPITKDNISIEAIDMDPETKKSLRKMGVSSVNDLEKIERKNVDLEKMGSKKVSYKNLADIINKSKRGNLPPIVSKVSLSLGQENPMLIVEGTNLHMDNKFPPVAVLNNKLANILASNSKQLMIGLESDTMHSGKNELVMTLDPYAIFKLEINK